MRYLLKAVIFLVTFTFFIIAILNDWSMRELLVLGIILLLSNSDINAMDTQRRLDKLNRKY